MRKSTKSVILILFGLLILSGCKQEEGNIEESNNEAAKYIAQVRQTYVPDKRVAIFDVESVKKDEKYVLRGESNFPEAVSSLKEKLQQEGINYTDSIEMLPAAHLGEKTHALVNISVANIRSNPSHSAELATQATLGTPLKVLKQEGDWYLVQTPDKYLSWVDHGGIARISEEELNAWKASEKVIFLKPFGQTYKKPDAGSEVVSDAVAGNIFELRGVKNGFFEVEFPDGRIAYIEEDQAQQYREWLSSQDQSKEGLVQTAKELMGLPYLWGGTSSKGVDCSGYTKTVFFLNGMVIPRDASQQVHTGKVVDSLKNFQNLQKGDLLFFGTPGTATTKERVVHVGMWIGDGQFIHSSGKVHVSSMDTEASNFDEFNYNRYLRTKRLLGQEDKEIIQLADSNLFSRAE